MMKHEPAHAQRVPVARRRRPGWKWAAGGAVAAAVAGAVVAWALLQLRADIDGGGQVNAAANLEFEAVSQVGGSADCTTSVSGGDLQLQVNGTQGEHCDLSLTLKRVGDPGAPQVINGLTFSNDTHEGFTNGTCDAPGTVVTTTGTTVVARFTLTGSPGSFQADTNAGLTTTDEPTFDNGVPNRVQGCPVAA